MPSSFSRRHIINVNNLINTTSPILFIPQFRQTMQIFFSSTFPTKAQPSEVAGEAGEGQYEKETGEA